MCPVNFVCSVLDKRTEEGVPEYLVANVDLNEDFTVVPLDVRMD
jgi:hypothetical protein